MRVYLVRHGQAVDSDVDPARPLSDAGKREAVKLAQFAMRAGVKADEVWHSPKDRARQTAELLNEGGQLGGTLKEREGLLPDDDVSGVARDLAVASEDVCVVGHLPYLGYLAAALLEGPDAASFIAFDTAGMLCLEREGVGPWVLRWLVSPAIL